MERGFVVWFTGLPASGKTTLAKAVAHQLRQRGVPHVQRLDGDVVRQDLTRDLGFSKADRDENIRRVSFVAGLLAQNGVAVLAAFVSPYRDARRAARARAPQFVEVYCQAPVEVLIDRDPKGMYKKALAGEITGFTGIDDPYEEPEDPEVVCNTDRETVAESAAKVVNYLEEHGYIAASASRLAATPPAAAGHHSALPHGGALVQRVLTGKEAQAMRKEMPGLPAIRLSEYHLREFLCLATGVYSPLTGFLRAPVYDSVVETLRLPDATVWPLPIVLPVDEQVADQLRPGGLAALSTPGGDPVGIIEDVQVYARDPWREARQVFGTDDPDHPGVARLLAEPKALVGGEVWAISLPRPEFPDISLTPAQTRQVIADRGWRTVAAFQTRNPLHRAHEYLLRCGLECCDGLLLSPLMGETKPGDVPAPVRLATYRALIEGYFPEDRVLVAAFPANMRYAGPREAIFHALCRKNFGATHFIVGRDHAGVGDYYGPYEAQAMFDRFAPDELGIQPLKFQPAFWCNRCGGMATDKTCPHPEEHRLTLSGTQVRALLAQGQLPPPEITRPEVAEILIQAARGSQPASAGQASRGGR
ncbi:MAG: sulfate adenylyltransferase [Candidatus Bipolaricaulaceae bacterium]